MRVVGLAGVTEHPVRERRVWLRSCMMGDALPGIEVVMPD
jgi:hypothetical protein